jgi:nucleoside-diphosphate-sugar epimerase
MKLDATIHDLDQKNDKKSLPDCSKRDVYYFAPPSTIDEQDHRIKKFLNQCRHQAPRRIVYISTSGVYGDCKGQWVDENQPTRPITSRAKRRLDAEQSLLAFCHDTLCEYIILRVGGIYGKERLPIHRLKDIKVINEDEAPYSNRIHVEDLARVCWAAMQAEISNEIFNVADGNPTSMSDYYNSIADHAGLPRPTSVPLSQAKEQLSAAMLSFINESRRLNISKLRSTLKISPQLPTLKDGLKYCFQEGYDAVDC